MANRMNITEKIVETFGNNINFATYCKIATGVNEEISNESFINVVDIINEHQYLWEATNVANPFAQTKIDEFRDTCSAIFSSISEQDPDKKAVLKKAAYSAIVSELFLVDTHVAEFA